MTLLFDALDPFPFAPEGTPYAAEKAHAAAADAWLGLATAATERALAPAGPAAETWAHVGADTFLTPYTELRRMLALVDLKAGERIVDLGAGYGRLGFVVEKHTAANFLGLELVAERVAEGARALARFGAKRAELIQADLARPDFSPPPAAWYFVYDYGTRAAIEKTLRDLRERAKAGPVRLVGRGRAVRDAIERSHPWLGEVVAPRHHGNFSLYVSSEE